MTRQTIATAVFSIVASLTAALPARAGDIIQSLPDSDMNSNNGVSYYYDSNDSYDFISSFPSPGEITNVGTFTFTIPADETVTGITISGTFGNGDNQTTAESDYFLTDGTNEVEVAACESITADCYDNQNGPTPWSYTFTAADLGTLSSAIGSGSLDFTYTWVTPTEGAVAGNYQYVYAGDPTIDIQLASTPEPATVLICLGGLAGIAALRRFRKV
jgi:hypothetical protein